MIEFGLHPNIYATGNHKGLRSMLEDVWIRSHKPGNGTLYILAGFANYNGGARFYKTFRLWCINREAGTIRLSVLNS